MNKKAKIIVLHMKEVIYTGLFLLLGILFIVILILMFTSKKDSETSQSLYTPGQYTTSLTFQGNVVDVMVTVDKNSIIDISLNQLEDSVSVMYPLMEPTLEELSTEILEKQSLENISYTENSKYTSMILLDAIASSLEQAKNISGNHTLSQNQLP